MWSMKTDALNYNADFVKRNNRRTAEPNETTRNQTPVTTATISHIEGNSESIADPSALQYPRSPQNDNYRVRVTTFIDQLYT